MPCRCAIVGCGAPRTTNTVLSFFKIRQRKYPEWQQALLAAVNQCDRNVDINSAAICSRHFTPDCIKKHMCGRSTLLPGSLPTLWMPTKSVETPKPPRKAIAVTGLGTSTNQLSTGMEPNNSAMAGLKLEFDVGEDPQGNCAYTDDARKSRGPDHSGSNYAEVSEQPSGMFGQKVEMNTKTPDPDLAEAEDPFTAVNIQVKKEPVSDSGDDTSHDDTGSRGPDHAEVSEKPSGAGFGMFGLKIKLKTETPDPDLAETKDPYTALNIQVKKEPVSGSGDDTSDDDTEGYNASDTDWHVTFSNSDRNLDDGDSNMNNRKITMEVDEDPITRKRRKAKERQERWRAKQTLQSVEALRAKDNESHKKRLRSLSPAQLQAHRAANAASQRKRISLMSPAQLQAHRAANAASQHQRVSRMSPAQLQAHRVANAASQQQRVSRMSPAQLQAHQAANAASQRQRISLMSPAQLQSHRVANAASQQQHRERLNEALRWEAIILNVSNTVQHDCGQFGGQSLNCQYCGAKHFEGERPSDGLFTACCHKGKVMLPKPQDINGDVVEYPDAHTHKHKHC